MTAMLYFLTFLLLVASSVAWTNGPLVTLDFGTFMGANDTATGIDTFYGIPFAAPPVGSSRLRQPQPFAGFGNDTSVQDATLPKSDCSQQSSAPLNLTAYNITLPANLFAPLNGSEDCLYLNIVRPSGLNSSSALPVMFWIYGGSFERGGISQYDGSSFVAQSMNMSQPVIWVAANYRLAGWGFMPGQEIQDAGLGNLGLLDQRAALLWVQKYISEFGGDPTKVTIFGDEAGAFSVGWQMMLYGGENNGTFRAAILDSGSMMPVGPLTYGQGTFNQILDQTNCSTALDKIECLRELNETTFASAIATVPYVWTAYRPLQLAFVPRPDNKTIPDWAPTLLRQGNFSKVPILIGDNEDDGTLYQFTSLNVTTDDEFADYISGYYPSLNSATLDAILAAYPSDPSFGSPFGTYQWNLTAQDKRISAVVGDMTFQAPRVFLEYIYLNASLPIWSWSIETVTANTTWLGSYVTSDLSYTYSSDQQQTTRQIRSTWIAFANSLDPNSVGDYDSPNYLNDWPSYSEAGPPFNMTTQQRSWMYFYGAYGLGLEYVRPGMDLYLDNVEQFVW